VVFVIVFTLGYLFGGVTALVIMGLTVAARRGDTEPPRLQHGEEITPIWRERL
jgi:hypothetical protein